MLDEIGDFPLLLVTVSTAVPLLGSYLYDCRGGKMKTLSKGWTDCPWLQYQ